MIIQEEIVSKRNLDVDVVGISEEEFIHRLISGKVVHENDYFFEIGKDKIIGKIIKHNNFKTQTTYEIGD